MTPSSPEHDLILASGSPRRRELVERLGWRVEVIVSDIPESRQPREAPEAYARRLAREKVRDVAAGLEADSPHPDWLLAADTIVVFEDEVLEKPGDAEEARAMLRAMSGEWHEVVTAFVWHHHRTEDEEGRALRTNVRLRDLDDETIRHYVATGEPFDKAGSYGIQDFGALLVDEIEGSYFNVVGLPIAEVVASLETIGAGELHPFVETDAG